jgi:hypothetical protein
MKKREKRTLPTVLPDERMMIDMVATTWLPLIMERLWASGSEAWLEDTLCRFIRSGFIETLAVEKAASKGDIISDRALRRVFAEMTNAGQYPGAVIWAYGIKAAQCPPVERGQGHVWFTNWHRDLGIACLVFLVGKNFSLPFTRNEKQRARGEPSSSSVVSGALGQRRINVAERTIDNIFGRLHGQIAAFVLDRKRVPR